MTLPDIHKAFEELLEPNSLVKQRQRRAIGMDGRKAAWYRWQNRQGRLTIQTKVDWLKRAGFDKLNLTAIQYSRADMIDFLRFSRRKDSQRSAGKLGDEYLFTKYLLWVKQGRPAVISTGV